MDVFLAIVVVLVVALMATSARLYRVRRTRIMSLLFSGGWPALVVGVALGPEVSGLIEADTILAATPLLVAGLGWVGLMVGMQCRRDLFAQLPNFSAAVVALDGVATAFIAGGVAIVGLGVWTGWTPGWPEYVEPVAVLIAASTGWAMETRSLSPSRSAPSQRVALLVRVTGGLGAVAAITEFGIAEKLVIQRDGGMVAAGLADAATGLAITLTLACLAGLLGRFAIERAGKSGGEQLAVYFGLVALVAGVATQLGYSPLLAAMCTGIVVANISTTNLLQFERFIVNAEHIIAVIVFMLAGLLMRLSIGWPEVLLACALTLSRAAYKPLVLAWGLGRAGARSPDKAEPPDLNAAGALRFGPIRQSAVAAPIALGLVLLSPSEFNRRLLTIVVVCGILSALLTVALAAWKSRSLRSAAP